MALKRPRIVTLESFIIDSFVHLDKQGRPAKTQQSDQIGGAGSYAVIGARIFLPPARLGMIVHYTPDTLPDAMRAKLESFGTDMWCFRTRTDGHGTTRAVNTYGGPSGQVREFEYLSPPLLLTPRSLLDTSFASPLPSWIHQVSMPQRALQSIQEVADMSLEIPGGWEPGFLWEPEPPCCTPENLPVISRITPQVDVISPNHTEALRLFGVPTPPEEDLQLTLEWLTRRLLALHPRIGAVLRAGPLGCCYALTAEMQAAAAGASDANAHLPTVPVHWVPPYWQEGVEGYETAVVDPTGAGNAFMGGLMAALDEGKSLDEAVLCANVSASFVIEQAGLPTVASLLGRECWNNDYPWERVERLRQRRDEGL